MQQTKNTSARCRPSLFTWRLFTGWPAAIAAAALLGTFWMSLGGPAARAAATALSVRRGTRDIVDAGYVLRVTPPVQLTYASGGKSFDAQWDDALHAGDRIEIGRGGAVEICLIATGRRYRLSVAANAPGAGAARAAHAQINRDGSDIDTAAPASANSPQVTIARLRTISRQIAGKFSPDGRVGPKSGSVAVRGGFGIGPISPLEDALADPTQDAVVRWEALRHGFTPYSAVFVTISRFGAETGGDGSAVPEPVWHATLTAAKPDAILPHGTLAAGQRYVWSLQPQIPSRAAFASDVTPMSGSLFVLGDSDRVALAADIADLRDSVSADDIRTDATMPLIQEALILRHYSLWTRTADTLKVALTGNDDPQLRDRVKTLLEHPLGIRPAPEAGAVR